MHETCSACTHPVHDGICGNADTCPCQWKFVPAVGSKNSNQPRNWFVGDGVLTLYPVGIASPTDHRTPRVQVRPTTIDGARGFRITHTIDPEHHRVDVVPDLVSALQRGQDWLSV